MGGRWHKALLAAWSLAALLWSLPAHAQFPPITDRNFAIDLFQGPVVGSANIVGMGGASIATAQGSATIPANPASPAVRASTSTSRWDWDFHIDWLAPTFADDIDNNGQDDGSTSVFPLFTGGILGQFKQWGLGMNFVTQQRAYQQAGTDNQVRPRSTVFTISFARSFLQRRLTVGINARAGRFEFRTKAPGQEARTLFSLDGGSLEVGTLLRPHDTSIRWGFTASAPVLTKDVDVNNCDPNNCEGFILPERAVLPWRVGSGIAWRGGPTPWNRKFTTPYRDERAITLAADVVVTGSIGNGAGFQAFGENQLQRSGDEVVVGVHGGAELEAIPGWFRLRAGSYWEPSRFRGVSGRTHGTAGLEVRLFGFKLWGHPYRVRLTITGDIAKDYTNTGLSIGFWH